MNLEPKFLKYEENNEPQAKFKGVATISLFNNAIILRYQIKEGREGKGFFVQPISFKMNDEWLSGSTIDSNYANEEINSLIRKYVNAYYKGENKQFETPSKNSHPGITLLDMEPSDLPKNWGKIIVDDEAVPF